MRCLHAQGPTLAPTASPTFPPAVMLAAVAATLQRNASAARVADSELSAGLARAAGISAERVVISWPRLLILSPTAALWADESTAIGALARLLRSSAALVDLGLEAIAVDPPPRASTAPTGAQPAARALLSQGQLHGEDEVDAQPDHVDALHSRRDGSESSQAGELERRIDQLELEFRSFRSSF